jgi:hypothetical protein
MKRVVRGTLLCWVVSIALAAPAVAGPACGSFPAKVPDPALDLAPPEGFTEICSQDQELCKKLTSHYPKAKTLGYFVSTEEWKRYKEKKDTTSITRTLIAQWAENMQPAQFADLQKFMRSRHGKDATAAPVFGKSGQADIPIFEDAPDAIGAGMLMKGKSSKPGQPEALNAFLNIAMLNGPRVLSLYVTADVTATPNAEPAKALAKDWLRCLRAAAKPAKAAKPANPEKTEKAEKK